MNTPSLLHQTLYITGGAQNIKVAIQKLYIYRGSGSKDQSFVKAVPLLKACSIFCFKAASTLSFVVSSLTDAKAFWTYSLQQKSSINQLKNITKQVYHWLDQIMKAAYDKIWPLSYRNRGHKETSQDFYSYANLKLLSFSFNLIPKSSFFIYFFLCMYRLVVCDFTCYDS